MSNPIVKGLALGYTAQQILGFLSKAFPSLNNRVNKANRAGHSAQSILQYISNSMENEAVPHNVPARKREALRKERQEMLTKDLVKFGLGTLATAGIARAIPALLGRGGAAATAATGIGASPNPPGAPGGPSGGPQPMGNAPIKPPPIPPAPGPSPVSPPQTVIGKPPGQPATAEPIEPKPFSREGLQQQAKVLETPKEASIDIVKELGLEKLIDRSRQQGKNVEEIAEDLRKALTPDQRKFFGEKLKTGEAKPLIPAVEKYLATARPPIKEPVTTLKKEEIKTAPNKIEKDSLVAVPELGAGEVVHTRGNKALVNIDGKKHEIDISDIELPSENMIQSVAEILKIPEIDRSSVINYWSYDPSDQELFVMFHDGNTYKYRDVAEDTISTLAEAMGIPKTEGENIFGAWSPEDKKSVGATMIQQIIADPKYKKPNRKKNEPENPNYQLLRKGYDYWSPLRKQKKRK